MGMLRLQALTLPGYYVLAYVSYRNQCTMAAPHQYSLLSDVWVPSTCAKHALTMLYYLKGLFSEVYKAGTNRPYFIFGVVLV